jgi:hypothetical protein
MSYYKPDCERRLLRSCLVYELRELSQIKCLIRRRKMADKWYRGELFGLLNFGGVCNFRTQREVIEKVVENPSIMRRHRYNIAKEE